MGHVCLSLLFYWNQGYSIREVISSIYGLFYLGNADSCYGPDRAKEMKNNRPLFDKKAEYFTKKYANPDLDYIEYKSWDFTYNP